MRTSLPAPASPESPGSFGGWTPVDVLGLEVPGVDELPRVGSEVEIGVLAGFLSALDLGFLASDFEVLEAVAAWEPVAAAASAAQVLAVGELAARPEVYGQTYPARTRSRHRSTSSMRWHPSVATKRGP